MPFCEARHGAGEAVRLFYELYGDGDTKVLLIMGLAGPHNAWGFQLRHLVGTEVPNPSPPEATPPPRDHPSVSTEGVGLGIVADLGLQSEAAVLGNVGNGNEVETPRRAPAGGAEVDGGGVQRDGLDGWSGCSEERGGLPEGGNGVQVGGSGLQCCAYDNRGVGKSSMPVLKSDYSTSIMALDALSLLDHLQWEKAHIVGHSMGAMIACKLASMRPERVASLALVSVTGGGYDCIPPLDRTLLKISYRFLRAKTPEKRAEVDLDCHFTQEYLDEKVDNGATRREVLYKEYVQGITASGLQPEHGLRGHMNACWYHSLSKHEAKAIAQGDFPVSAIHGRGDIIAALKYAERVVQKLAPVAKIIPLNGGHLVLREAAEQVNGALVSLIEAAKNGVRGVHWGAQEGTETPPPSPSRELYAESLPDPAKVLALLKLSGGANLLRYYFSSPVSALWSRLLYLWGSSRFALLPWSSPLVT